MHHPTVDRELVDNCNSRLVQDFITKLFLGRDIIFFYDEYQQYTGNCVLNKINEILKLVSESSLPKKTNFLLKAVNSFNWICVYLSAKLLNKLVFITSEDMLDQDILDLTESFDIRLVFSDQTLKVVNYDYDAKSEILDSFSLKDQISYDILFTTGTTGKPKGVILSENAYLETAKTLIKKSQQNKNDFELLSMPFSHSFGLARLRTCLVTGQKAFLADGLKNFPKLYGYIKKYSINGFSFVPAALEIVRVMLKKQSIEFGSQVKYLEIGSSSLSREIRIWLKDNFKNALIFHHYGMTEASRSFFTSRGAKDNFEKDGSYVGAPAENVNFKIKKIKNSDFSNATFGEILITGPHLSTGYFTISKKVAYFETGQWFATKDLGLVRDGDLFLVGKIDTMINVGGEKVYPENIEKLVEKNCKVQKVTCFSIPDDVLGENIGMLIERKRDKKFKDVDSLKFVSSFLRTLPLNQRPKKMKVVNAIPMTENGKKVRDEVFLRSILEIND